MANGLALERCPLWGKDPAHEDDCWRVYNFRVMEIATRDYPVVATHIPFREAMALVMDIPLEEIERMATQFENETPEEEAAWWNAFSKEAEEK